MWSGEKWQIGNQDLAAFRIIITDERITGEKMVTTRAWDVVKIANQDAVITPYNIHTCGFGILLAYAVRYT
jgi:hypothetical protein